MAERSFDRNMLEIPITFVLQAGTVLHVPRYHSIAGSILTVSIRSYLSWRSPETWLQYLICRCICVVLSYLALHISHTCLEILTLASALDRSRGIISKRVLHTQTPSLQKQLCNILNLVVRGEPVNARSWSRPACSRYA